MTDEIEEPKKIKAPKKAKVDYVVRPGGANTTNPCQVCNGTGLEGGGPSKWVCDHVEKDVITESHAFATEDEAKAYADNA